MKSRPDASARSVNHSPPPAVAGGWWLVVGSGPDADRSGRSVPQLTDSSRSARTRREVPIASRRPRAAVRSSNIDTAILPRSRPGSRGIGGWWLVVGSCRRSLVLAWLVVTAFAREALRRSAQALAEAEDPPLQSLDQKCVNEVSVAKGDEAGTTRNGGKRGTGGNDSLPAPPAPPALSLEVVRSRPSR